jgi:membrane protease YdiL (CAAX protease family)
MSADNPQGQTRVPRKPMDPVQLALRVGLYVFLAFIGMYVCAKVLQFFGPLVAITFSVFMASAAANALTMRIYEGLTLVDVGLNWNRAARRNLLIGLVGGIGSASLVLAGPLLVGAAHFSRLADSQANWRMVLFVPLMLLFGAAGEELLFRGYAFQILMRSWGPYATILPVGVIFAAMHSANPHANYLAMANTAGFGFLFGYAFLRSYDLWTPIGLHFGWNLTLPFFGVNISGLTMRVTDYALDWRVGPLWSGGDYGPEASVLTSFMLIVLAVYLARAPIQPNPATLLGYSAEN